MTTRSPFQPQHLLRSEESAANLDTATATAEPTVQRGGDPAECRELPWCECSPPREGLRVPSLAGSPRAGELPRGEARDPRAGEAAATCAASINRTRGQDTIEMINPGMAPPPRSWLRRSSLPSAWLGQPRRRLVCGRGGGSGGGLSNAHTGPSDGGGSQRWVYLGGEPMPAAAPPSHISRCLNRTGEGGQQNNSTGMS